MSLAATFIQTLARVGEATIDGLAERNNPAGKKRRRKVPCTPCAAKQRAREALERSRQR